MDQKKVAVIPITCGFKANPKDVAFFWQAFSDVDHDRINAALTLINPGNKVYIAGEVPYCATEGHASLGELVTYSISARHRHPLSLTRLPGLNAFSESYYAGKQARRDGCLKLIVVASDFYFAAYRQLWLKVAERHGFKIELVAAPHAPGLVAPEVKNFYLSAKMRLLVWLAVSSRLGHCLAMAIADLLTSDRGLKGFPFDGHTRLG